MLSWRGNRPLLRNNLPIGKKAAPHKGGAVQGPGSIGVAGKAAKPCDVSGRAAARKAVFRPNGENRPAGCLLELAFDADRNVAAHIIMEAGGRIGETWDTRAWQQGCACIAKIGDVDKGFALA